MRSLVLLLALAFSSRPAWSLGGGISEQPASSPGQYIVSLTSPTNQSFPENTESIVFWVTETSDTANGFVSTSSDVITAVTTGIYLVMCMTGYTDTSTTHRTHIYHNTQEVSRNTCDPVNATFIPCPTQKVIYAAKNDTFQCRSYHNGSSASQFPDTALERSFFQATRLWSQ